MANFLTPFALFGNAAENGIIGGSDTIPGIGVLIAILLAVSAVSLIVTLIHYVLYCFGIFRIAKKLDVELAWLAWIPYAQYYTLGKVAEKCDERAGNFSPRPWAKIVLFGAIGTMVVYAILYVVNLLLSHSLCRLYSESADCRSHDGDRAGAAGTGQHLPLEDIPGIFPRDRQRRALYRGHRAQRTGNHHSDCKLLQAPVCKG